jgi:hypothetical protein
LSEKSFTSASALSILAGASLLCTSRVLAVEFSATILPTKGQTLYAASVPKMNNRGEVVAGVSFGSDIREQGVAWDVNHEFHTLDGVYGSSVGRVNINDRGTIVGNGNGLLGTGRPYDIGGFVSSIDGPTTFFPVAADGSGYVAVMAVNNLGVMTAWTAAGVRTFGSGLDKTLRFDGTAVPNAINDSNKVVGWYDNGDSEHQGMFYDDGLEVHRFTSVKGCDAVYGMDVNNHGVALGTAYLSSAQMKVIWDAGGDFSQFTWGFTVTDGQMSYLSPLDGRLNPRGVSLNDSGWVAGMCDGTDLPIATLWIDGQPLDLNGLVTDLPAGFTLLAAIDVNNNCQVLTWAEDFRGGSYLTLLTPTQPVPEPTATLLLVATASLLQRRRY